MTIEGLLTQAFFFLKDIMKNKDENAKDSHWKTPVDLPHVSPEDDDTSVQRQPKGQAVTPKQVARTSRKNSV